MRYIRLSHMIHSYKIHRQFLWLSVLQHYSPGRKFARKLQTKEILLLLNCEKQFNFLLKKPLFLYKKTFIYYIIINKN